jgi:hypothetical protein
MKLLVRYLYEAKQNTALKLYDDRILVLMSNTIKVLLPAVSYDGTFYT